MALMGSFKAGFICKQHCRHWVKINPCVSALNELMLIGDFQGTF